MSKAISMYLNPQGGKIVSRTSEDTARMVAHAVMMTGDDRTSGTLVVRCDVSKHGVISLEAGEGNASRRNRELFYAQVAIDRSQESGIRLTRETVAPARPAGAISLSAAQVEELRRTLDTMNDRAGLGSRRSDQDDTARADFRQAHQIARAMLGE